MSADLSQRAEFALSKRRVRREATWTREALRQLDDAMRENDWQRVAAIAAEISAVWGTVSDDA